jgi:hypothetical protein
MEKRVSQTAIIHMLLKAVLHGVFCEMITIRWARAVEDSESTYPAVRVGRQRLVHQALRRGQLCPARRHRRMEHCRRYLFTIVCQIVFAYQAVHYVPVVQVLQVHRATQVHLSALRQRLCSYWMAYRQVFLVDHCFLLVPGRLHK